MTPAVRLLERRGVSHRLHSYEHDPAAESYGLEAAQALAVEPGRVFKTLLADVEGRGLVVAVVPVDRQLDLKALAGAVGAKRVRMAEPQAAERATGYVVGGISPLGQKKRLPLRLDDSAGRFETIFVSGGRRGLEIEIAPTDLLALTDGKSAALAR